MQHKQSCYIQNTEYSELRTLQDRTSGKAISKQVKFLEVVAGKSGYGKTRQEVMNLVEWYVIKEP